MKLLKTLIPFTIVLASTIMVPMIATNCAAPSNPFQDYKCGDAIEINNQKDANNLKSIALPYINYQGASDSKILDNFSDATDVFTDWIISPTYWENTNDVERNLILSSKIYWSIAYTLAKTYSGVGQYSIGITGVTQNGIFVSNVFGSKTITTTSTITINGGSINSGSTIGFTKQSNRYIWSMTGISPLLPITALENYTLNYS